MVTDDEQTRTDLLGPRGIVAATTVSMAGHVVHNLTEFPPSILLAPETLGPVAVTGLLGVALLRRPPRIAYLTAGAWATVVLMVGGASVLPLSILPFEPEQTFGYYGAHVVYALAQLPLLWIAWRGARGEGDRPRRPTQ